MTRRSAGLTGLLLMLSCLFSYEPARAQAEFNLAIPIRAANLTFPTEISDIAAAREPVMALYKPAGDGPFPALVLMHQCAGLRIGPAKLPNKSMLTWAQSAVARGYAVLVMDTLTQRGAESLCFGPQKDINPARGALDALHASAYMSAQPFVDKDRIAYAGFSWGAGIGLLIGSAQASRKLGRPDHYAAVVSSYPPCIARPRDGTPPYTSALSGGDRPLLVLFGGRDTETPPSDCIALLERNQKAGAPVAWHVYPDMTHCWDCAQLHGRKSKDINGNLNEYIYDEAVTRDTTVRMFAFIDAPFKKRRGA